MVIEIVDLPIDSMVIFHSFFVNVYQRVSLLVGKAMTTSLSYSPSTVQVIFCVNLAIIKPKFPLKS